LRHEFSGGRGGAPDHGVEFTFFGRKTRANRCWPAIRDARQIDIQGTMQTVTSVIEGWIHEYPNQWLWLHPRWW